MLNNLKQRLITGWTFMRIIRLALAVIITYEAWKNSEIIFALLGGFLLFQAAFNYGCCGVSGCNINHIPNKQKSLSKNQEVTTFEEVK